MIMDKKTRKVHTGFRLSPENYLLLEKYENRLGLNKTSVIDLLLTLVRSDEKLVVDLFKKSLAK